MISLEELNKEINILEEKEPTYAGMQQLAALYVVKDHMRPETSGDDFVSIAYRDIDKTIAVMKDLMETLAVINPRLHDGVMREIL